MKFRKTNSKSCKDKSNEFINNFKGKSLNKYVNDIFTSFLLKFELNVRR